MFFEILDLIEAYKIEFSSAEYENTKLEISKEQSDKIESAHDRLDREKYKESLT